MQVLQLFEFYYLRLAFLKKFNAILLVSSSLSSAISLPSSGNANAIESALKPSKSSNLKYIFNVRSFYN